MNQVMQFARNSWRATLTGAIGALIFYAPIGLYMKTFGDTLSTKHDRWAEMGAAMSGIYGPLLAGLTLYVLFKQLQLQDQTTKHMHDHARLMNARTDMEFYLVRLVEVLDVDLPGMQTRRSILQRRFSNVTLEQLSSDAFRETADRLEASAPQLFAMWGAYYSALAGVRNVSDFDKDLHHISATDKAIAMLSFQTCVQLDQFHFCRAEGAFPTKYLFSPMLNERRQ